MSSSAAKSDVTRSEISLRGRAVVVLEASEAQPNRFSSEKVTDDFRCHFLFPSHGIGFVLRPAGFAPLGMII